MKILRKYKIGTLVLGVIPVLSGCVATVNAPKGFDLNLPLVIPKAVVVESPNIGAISTAELGDSLVSKYAYMATPGFMLIEPHVISKSGDKRVELQGHCWISKLPIGYYVAVKENKESIFYALDNSPSTNTLSTVPCEKGERPFSQAGFVQSKNQKNEYKSWYLVEWNINDTLSENKIKLKPFVSEEGVFKREFYYNGKTGSQLKFSYREFTEDGMARGSFSQDVVYDLNDSSVIGFKGSQFEIIEATNTKITYKVISYFR